MRRFGLGEDRIARARAAFDQPIFVHPNNWDVVQVFRLCTIPSVGTFAGVASVQIPVVEIAQAASIWGVPVTPHIVHGVRIMGAAYCETRNAAAARR